MRPLAKLLIFVPLLVVAAAGTVQAQADGFRLGLDRVEVQTQAHWQTWKMPSDMVEISPAGSVQSKFIQAPHNAIGDAAEFSYEIAGNLESQYANAAKDDNNKLIAQGGIKGAGTNAFAAANIMDGDPNTFWQPDIDDPLQDWIIEIDLGRLVSLTKVVLRFAEEGDPFLQFRVHSAGGQNPFGTSDRSGALDYTLVGGTTQPNRDQRVFEFDLTPLGKHTEGWTGRMVQYLRIAVTATNGDKAEEVSEADYQALSAADQGATEYIWQIAGEERLVSAQRYAELAAEERGGIRYYRREQPRLADVEAWTLGQNVALGLIERGGFLHDVNPNSSPELAFDGNMRTEWSGAVYDIVGETAEWGLLNVDLGTHFRVHAVRTITRVLNRDGRVLLGYLLRGSDGSRAPDGSFIWDELSEESRLLNQDTRLFNDSFEPQNIRFLEFRNMDIARRTNAHLGHRILSVITEIQVFANGYLPTIEMTSNLIDLGGAKTLTTIDWDAITPPNTAVEIRTRSGDDLQEVNRYFKKDGTEVATEEDYEELPSFFKGEITVEFLPGQGWSPWSQAYLEPGEIVRSPSPRRYIMLQARLLSNDPNAAPSLNSIQVHFTAPLVESIAAEIAPKRDLPIGEPIDFDIFIRPSFNRQNPGFDRIRLLAPSRAAITLDQVALGDQSSLVAQTAETYTLAEDGIFKNREGLALELVGELTDSLSIGLPAMIRPNGAELVQLSFRARVFQSGSTFQIEVGNSSQPDSWQKVDSGDVVDDQIGLGRGLNVLTEAAGQTIQILAVPSLFTPNGDGVNDEAVFEFAVLKVNVGREVAVELFDLAGRQVRRLVEARSLANGLYQIPWDGLDKDGNRLPPGLYLASIKVDSDQGQDNTKERIVGLAY